MSFWFNISTGQVETDDNRGRDEDVMGPYGTHEEAARALQTARERTEKWDAEDRAWEAGSQGWDDDRDGED